MLPYGLLFGGLLLLFTLVTLGHQTTPGRVESFIKVIPWFGPRIFRNSHLRRGITLRSLESGYQTILGERKVFVISGEVVNQNPVSMRAVQVEGHVYGEGGKELAAQTISVGNAISSKIIRDMTAQEIGLLQRLNPQKRFEVPPGDSTTFAIVFLQTNHNVEAFSCRILSAEEAL